MTRRRKRSRTSPHLKADASSLNRISPGISSQLIAKTAKRRKQSSATSHTKADIISPNQPRLNSQERLLSRFYEPLVLLYTLGRTRGEHTSTEIFSQEHMNFLPLKDLRRIFLKELAYMCDFDKGGETVTALGLQSTPQGHIFWVASNAGSKPKTIDFLRSLLTKVMHMSANPTTMECTEEVASQCIAFATPRIKKYRNHLKPLLRKCNAYLTGTHRMVEPGLVEWLRSWEQVRSPLDLCRYAYVNRKSDFMRTLARLSAEPNYKSNRDAIHSTFGMIRHYIGRLGYHFRAVDVLLCCAPRLANLLHDFEVRGVPILPKSTMPPPDQLTRADKILVRMLPDKSPDLERYQQAFTNMDSRYQVFRRFLENYTEPDLKPCVHAEIQVLEQFYTHGMQFAGDDPFIACSKPACFCCLLYFRNHPGHFVEPTSHNKIYLNWRPPDLSTLFGIIDPNHQRDILNAMTREIRKEALRQIHGRSAPQAWHPDSLTGITQSSQHDRDRESIKDADFVSNLAGGTPVCSDSSGYSPLLGPVHPPLFHPTIEGEDRRVTELKHGVSNLLAL